MAEKNAHLLIVDDEENIRSALRRVLRREYKLSFAASGPEALQLLKTERPDVIISDHLMPEMTGLEFLKRCRLLYPQIGRIVLTGQAEMQMVIAAINEGAVFRFLTKPWDEDELKLTVYLAVEHVKSQREAQESPSDSTSTAESNTAYESLVNELETQHPGLTQLNRNQDGAIIIDDPSTQEE